MKTEIPNWVTEYNNAGHQSSAGRAIKILMARVSELEHGWISVKDRLPEEGHSVLVYYENHEDVTVGRRWNDHRDKNGYHWKLEGREAEYDTDDITHWMPLPNPPQQ